MGVKLPPAWEPPPGGMHIYPTQLAPFIRRPPERDSGDEAVPDLEMVAGHFGLLPGFAKEVKYGLNTYNARSETVAQLASFKNAWAKARRCIIPCKAIYEPDWRAGLDKPSVPTRFTAASDDALGVAGLWAPWKHPATGEWKLSFTMLTINADTHPLFKHMHKPDLKRPIDKQDKRMVVVLPPAQYEAWLDATPQEAFEFMREYPAELLTMAPEPLLPKVPRAKELPQLPVQPGLL